MLNQLVLVGRIVNPLEVINSQKESEKLSKMMKLMISVTRPFKNKNGLYDEDYITVKVWSNLISDITNSLVVDSMIIVKGRVQSFQFKDNENHYLEIIADRINKISLSE